MKMFDSNFPLPSPLNIIQLHNAFPIQLHNLRSLCFLEQLSPGQLSPKLKLALWVFWVVWATSCRQVANLRGHFDIYNQHFTCAIVKICNPSIEYHKEEWKKKVVEDFMNLNILTKYDTRQHLLLESSNSGKSKWGKPPNWLWLCILKKNPKH